MLGNRSGYEVGNSYTNGLSMTGLDLSVDEELSRVIEPFLTQINKIVERKIYSGNISIDAPSGN